MSWLIVTQLLCPSHLLDRLAGGWKTTTDGRFSFAARHGAFHLEQDEALATPTRFFSHADAGS